MGEACEWTRGRNRRALPPFRPASQDDRHYDEPWDHGIRQGHWGNACNAQNEQEEHHCGKDPEKQLHDSTSLRHSLMRCSPRSVTAVPHPTGSASWCYVAGCLNVCMSA